MDVGTSLTVGSREVPVSRLCFSFPCEVGDIHYREGRRDLGKSEMLREWRRLEWSLVGEGEKVVIRLLGSAKIQEYLAGDGDNSAELDHISPVVLIIPNAGV